MRISKLTYRELETMLSVQETAEEQGILPTAPDGLLRKMEEELGEVMEAATDGDPVRLREEFGDLLFTVVLAARAHGVNIGMALLETNLKVYHRCFYVRDRSKAAGRDTRELTEKEREDLWAEAKRQNGAGNGDV